jgi:hypothetical protein
LRAIWVSSVSLVDLGVHGLDFGTVDAQMRVPPSLRADAQAVAVRVGELDLPGPRLGRHGDSELGGDRIDVVDVEVHERAGSGVALVLGEVQVDVAATEEEVQREAVGEAVLADHLETEAFVPAGCGTAVGDPEDRHQLLGHTAKLTSVGLRRPDAFPYWSDDGQRDADEPEIPTEGGAAEQATDGAELDND